MNFAQIKGMLRTLSGRYDLVDDDPAKTIDTIINSASRFLDRISENQKSYGVHFVAMLTDAFKVSIPYCRSIKEVWIASTTARWQLDKKPVQDIIVEYLSSNDEVESGTSTYYAPTVTRKIPEDANLTSFSTYMTYMDTSVDIDHEHNAIVVVPPTDEDVMVEVRGLFYSKAFSDDDDENYWSVNHPTLLVMAALRELEVFNQNKSKVDAWTEAIVTYTTPIEKDLVDEDISEIDQMEG